MSFQREDTNSKVAEYKDSVNNPDPVPDKLENVTADMMISSGCTMTNLALSDTVGGGFLLGSMANVIGDSDTGKSLLAMALQAEAANQKRFDKYDLLYGNIEVGIHFPMEKMFGKNINRVKFFPENRKNPYTMQVWHEDLMKYTKKPIIYVLDSFDALTTEGIIEKAEKGESGKSFPEKAIISSAAWPTVIGQTEARKSLIIIISQTRTKIGSLFAEKTRQGGWALKFFSTCEMWLHKGGKIKRKIRGKDFHIGDWVIAKVARTRITGKKREVKFPVYYDYGVDDIEAMLQWMIDYKFYEVEKKKKSDVEEGEETGKVIDTCGDFINAQMSTVIKHIEDNNLENELKKIVQECWNEVEKELVTTRKAKY